MVSDAGNTFLEAVTPMIVDQGVRRLLLNFSALSQCDSMGISALLRIHSSLGNMGGYLGIYNVNELVSRVFSLTKVDDVLHICASEEEALARIAQPSELMPEL